MTGPRAGWTYEPQGFLPGFVPHLRGPGSRNKRRQMYKKQLKRVKGARRVVKRQQSLLAEMELEGVVGISFHTLTRRVTVAVAKEVASPAADACREWLREQLQQLRAEAQGLRRDWQESRELKARDQALAQAAKRALSSGEQPISHPGDQL